LLRAAAAPTSRRPRARVARRGRAAARDAIAARVESGVARRRDVPRRALPLPTTSSGTLHRAALHRARDATRARPGGATRDLGVACAFVLCVFVACLALARRAARQPPIKVAKRD
jgi:hypothetical protein